MRVTAAPDTECPMEGNPRKYITAIGPVEVPENTYYVRLINDGSLIRLPEAASKTKEVTGDGK